MRMLHRAPMDPLEGQQLKQKRADDNNDDDDDDTNDGTHEKKVALMHFEV